MALPAELVSSSDLTDLNTDLKDIYPDDHPYHHDDHPIHTDGPANDFSHGDKDNTFNYPNDHSDHPGNNEYDC